LQFVFKYIDPKDEEKPFVFTVAITAQKKYSGNALVHMLQVTLNFRLISFKTRSICSKLDQLVSIQISLGQVKNAGHKL